jgi:hypothetical protein
MVGTGSTGESPSEEDSVSAAIRAELDRCRPPLRDFGSGPEGHPGFARSDLNAHKYLIEPGRLPVIGALHIIMRSLIGTYALGRAEKLAWEYVFVFRGRVCSLALEKFGLRLYLEPKDGTDEAAEQHAILSKLSAASRSLEKNLLRGVVAEGLTTSQLLVRNQAGSLREMYKYFRKLAESAYAGDGILARKFDDKHQGELVTPSFRFMVEREEGLYATVAMIVAYFSLLEHLLVFGLAATAFDPATGSIEEFIGDTLLDKFKAIFEIESDPAARNYYNRLHEVAEKWRNPYSHGGFDKAGGALSITVPGLGAIPVMLSDIRTHPAFHLLPDRENSFDEVTGLFDELDAWLRQGKIWSGIAWAESGLNISFGADFLNDMRQAVTAGEFGEFLARVSYQVEQAENMDW